MTQTIAEQIKWNFKTNGELVIIDKNYKLIYWETSDGDWEKYERDSQGNQIYFENSNGDWAKSEYDSKGNKIYYEDSDGYWEKKELDSEGDIIYFESSSGLAIDKRPKPCSDKEIIIEGIKYKLVKV